MNVPALTLQDVVDDERAAGPEHSEGFRVERRLVGDVHRHMQGQCRVHGRVGESGGRCVPDLEMDAIGQARPLRQCRRHLAELRREVDAGDPASGQLHERPCGPPQSAAEVQHVRVGSEGERLDDLQRCRTAADVELVEWSEVGRSQSRAIQTGRLQGSADGRHKPTGAAVEPRNLAHPGIVTTSSRDVDDKIESVHDVSLWTVRARLRRVDLPSGHDFS